MTKQEIKIEIDKVQHQLRIISQRRTSLIGRHPGDDSPYAYDYGGYSVRDTRRGMTNYTKSYKTKLEELKDKYNKL